MKCCKCGDVRNLAMHRLCQHGGLCDYMADGTSHWITCKYRDQQPIAMISGQVAGCGCFSSLVNVYMCNYFNEPVTKHGHPCLDMLKKQVAGASGRTCIKCEVLSQNF